MPPDTLFSPARRTYAWYVVAVLMVAYTFSFVDRADARPPETFRQSRYP